MLRTFLQSVYGVEISSTETLPGSPARPTIRIRRAKVGDAHSDRVKADIAIFVSRILALLLVLSMLGIGVHLALEREMPPFLENVFWVSLGYLGGAFSAFLGGK